MERVAWCGDKSPGNSMLLRGISGVVLGYNSLDGARERIVSMVNITVKRRCENNCYSRTHFLTTCNTFWRPAVLYILFDVMTYFLTSWCTLPVDDSILCHGVFLKPFDIMIRPNKLTFLVLISIPLKKWRFFLARSNRDILMLTNMHLMVY